MTPSFSTHILELHRRRFLAFDGGTIEDDTFITIPEGFVPYELRMVKERPISGRPDALIWFVNRQEFDFWVVGEFFEFSLQNRWTIPNYDE